jgi:hypothetical protein
MATWRRFDCFRGFVSTNLAAVFITPLAGEARLAWMFFLHPVGIVRHVNLTGQAGGVDPNHSHPPFKI